MNEGKPQQNDGESPEQQAIPSSMDEVAEQFRGTQGVAMAQSPTSLLKELLSFVIRLGVILLIAVIAFTFFYGIHTVEDPGMMPVTHNGDLVLFYRLGDTYYINDLVILDFEGTRQIRRVIAVEGDEVDFSDGSIKINGVFHTDPHARGDTWAFEEGVEFPITIPPGELFLLGDYRERAIDSRIYNTVRIEDIRGRVITIIRRRML